MFVGEIHADDGNGSTFSRERRPNIGDPSKVTAKAAHVLLSRVDLIFVDGADNAAWAMVYWDEYMRGDDADRPALLDVNDAKLQYMNGSIRHGLRVNNRTIRRARLRLENAGKK